MTEITDENFLDIMLGPESDDGGSDDDQGSPSVGVEYEHKTYTTNNEEGANDDDNSNDNTSETQKTKDQLYALPPRAPVIRDQVVQQTMSMIERDIMEAEAALARKHRIRGTCC